LVARSRRALARQSLAKGTAVEHRAAPRQQHEHGLATQGTDQTAGGFDCHISDISNVECIAQAYPTNSPTPTSDIHCHFGSSLPSWQSRCPCAQAAKALPEPQAVDRKQLYGWRPSGTRLDTCHGMKAAQDRLVRHLAIAVVLKLVVLTALWWAFVRDERVGVDVDRAAAHMGSPVDATPLPSVPSGAQP
jgi:hypothetical protein